jgi:hypothetical protein
MAPNDAPGKPAIEDAVAQGRAAVARWTQAIKRPVTAATVAGAVVVGAAVVFGVGEVAVGAGVAYVAYRALKKRSRAQ